MRPVAEPVRILVSGDREWDSMAIVEREIKLALVHAKTKKVIFIGGGAPGLDTMMRIACTELNVHFAEVKALWNTRLRSAGPQRNGAMLWLQPHRLIAFHRNISKSKGTKDMIKQAKKAGIPVKLVSR